MDELCSPAKADHPRLNVGHEKLLHDPFQGSRSLGGLSKGAQGAF